MSQLQMFGMNIFLLVGILLLALIGFVLVVVFWTGIKVWWFRRAQALGRREERRRRFGADGRPRPPIAPGICRRCGQASPEVYHLDAGLRLCPTCYAAAAR
ncbi:MAG: hypothetical protein ACE5E1_01205 [Phycisphaerae bacterium]